MDNDKHEVVPYPLSRIGTIDLGQVGLRKHHVAGLLEVDVTEPLAQVRKQRFEGRPISFFAWMVKTIGTTIAEHRHVHGIPGPRHSTVVFEDVDISVIVERVVSGSRVPLPLVIRKTNEKPVEDIHAEILAAQRQPIRDEGDYVLQGNKLSRSAMRLYYALPQVLRLVLLGRVLKNPHRSKHLMGTALITSVGSVGRLPGWVIPKSMHNLCFALGSIIKKPWVVADRIEIRSILHMTVLFDHDVVDGAPAARFAARLVERIQRGT